MAEIPGELGRFLNLHRHHERPKVNEFLNTSKSLFKDLAVFLADPSHFKNPRINKLSSDLILFIDSDELNVDFTNSIPGFPTNIPACFTVRGEQKSELVLTPYLLFSNNFIKFVEDDPLLALQLVAFVSSQVRDYKQKKIYDPDSLVLSTNRSWAHQTDALLTLISMAKDEGIKLNIGESEKELLRKFPKGIDSFKEPVLQ